MRRDWGETRELIWSQSSSFQFFAACYHYTNFGRETDCKQSRGSNARNRESQAKVLAKGAYNKILQWILKLGKFGALSHCLAEKAYTTLFQEILQNYFELLLPAG